MRVHVVAPGRSLPEEAAGKVLELAEGTGVRLTIDEQCFASHGHFAGDDGVRAEAFIRAANDPSIDAVWFARGGYGFCRVVTRSLAELTEAARRKSYIGYSDAGYLLGALSAAGVGRSVHAPMVSDGLREGGGAAILRVLDWLVGEGGGEEPPAYAFNLAVLASLAATPHCPVFRGEAVMIEEVGEYHYAIDRMLFTLFASGKLEGARGLYLGRMSAIPQNDIPFGENEVAMVQRWCRAYGVAYLGRAPIGHDTDNAVVPFPSAKGR